MKDIDKSKEQLIDELVKLRKQVASLETQVETPKDANTPSDSTPQTSDSFEEKFCCLAEENYKVIDYLKDSRLFSHLSDKYLNQLVPLSCVSEYPAGTKIIRENQENNRVFFLINGEIEIIAGGQTIIRLRRQGDIFGEMSIISQKPAVATVIAKTPVKAFSIRGKDIGKYTEIETEELDNTLYRIFAMVMTDKLIMTTQKAKKFEVSEKRLLKEIRERKKTEKTLRDIELRLNKAQSVAKIGSWEYDIQNKLFWGSAQTLKIFSINHDQPDLPVDVIESLISDKQRIRRELNDLISYNKGLDIEFDIKAENRDPVAVRAIGELIWEDDVKKKVIGIVQDITEQKETGKERRQLQNQLFQAQKLDALGILASGIAHDFNNLLSVFYNYSELTIQKLANSPGNEKILDYQKSIRKAADRAENLINQILTFSRGGGYNPIHVDLMPFVKESIKFLRSSIPTTIIITHHMDPDIMNVYGDPVQIQQIIMNLCTNASHAMENKGGELDINITNYRIKEGSNTIEGLPPGNYVQISISDTGEGIENKVLQRIFEPFYTTKKAGKGTGLGLSVVHGIVKQHGGAIQVESEPGRGSTFRVFLPAVTGTVKQSSPRQTENLPRGTETILVVDDEILVRQSYAEMLELQGYNVQQASSGVQALEEFSNNTNRFDLIISDYTMPKMTGIELCSRIKKINEKVSTILISGLGQQISSNDPKASCIDIQLKKPIGFENFVKTIRKLLDQKIPQIEKHNTL